MLLDEIQKKRAKSCGRINVIQTDLNAFSLHYPDKFDYHTARPPLQGSVLEPCVLGSARIAVALMKSKMAMAHVAVHRASKIKDSFTKIIKILHLDAW